MSVRKNYRFDEFTVAMLEEIAEHLGKTQTGVLEQLIRDFVVFDLPPEVSQKLMQRATERLEEKKSDS